MTSKTVPVRVVPDDRRGPGWAWFTLPSAGGEPPDDASCWRFTLQRNQDGYFLATGAQWSAAEVWHQVHEVCLTDAGLQCLVGPELIDAVLADPRMVCRVHLLGTQSSQPVAVSGVLRFDRGVMASGASGQSPSAAQLAPAPIMAPIPVEVPVSPAPETVAQHEPSETPVNPAGVAPQPPRQKHGWWWVIGLLLLLIVGGGLLWYLQRDSSSVAPPVDPAVGASSGGSVVPAACSAQALQATSDDLIFLQACVADKPDASVVLTVIDAAKKAQRCDLLQRLYAHQAQAGQVEVALAYAREFDPATHQGGCFPKADVQTALYWYETILQNNPGRTDIAARVKELEALK